MLKRALSTAPILKMPDFCEEFVVKCNASGVDWVVLSQEGRPIAYYSNVLADRVLAKSREEINRIRVSSPTLAPLPFVTQVSGDNRPQALNESVATTNIHSGPTILVGQITWL